MMAGLHLRPLKAEQTPQSFEPVPQPSRWDLSTGTGVVSSHWWLSFPICKMGIMFTCRTGITDMIYMIRWEQGSAPTLSLLSDCLSPFLSQHLFHRLRIHQPGKFRGKKKRLKKMSPPQPPAAEDKEEGFPRLGNSVWGRRTLVSASHQRLEPMGQEKARGAGQRPGRDDSGDTPTSLRDAAPSWPGPTRLPSPWGSSQAEGC